MPVSENQRRKQKHEDSITRLFANLMDLPEARKGFCFFYLELCIWNLFFQLFLCRFFLLTFFYFLLTIFLEFDRFILQIQTHFTEKTQWFWCLQSLYSLKNKCV